MRADFAAANQGGLPLKNDRSGDQQPKEDCSNTGGTSHSRKSNFGVSGIGPPAWLRRERNALSHR
jgi:hypothetical protein